MDDCLPWPPDGARPHAAPDVSPEPRLSARLGGPGDVAAALPYLLGFAPQESLVLVGLGGAGGRRVGLTARADIPPKAQARAVARSLARSLRTDDPDAILLAIVSEAPDVATDGGLPHADLVHEVGLALDAHGIPLRDVLLVRAGRWWSYLRGDSCCQAGVGTPLPDGVGELAAASVASGLVVGRSRADLAARIARTPDGSPGAAGALLRVGSRPATDSPGRGSAPATEHLTVGDAERDWAVLSAALDRCGPIDHPAGRLPDDDVAAVVRALRDVRIRDRALGLCLGPRAAAAEVLWTECTRRAPAPLDAAPATLLAVTAWLRGDGAMANIALDRALESEPGYRLAALLARGLAACLHPRELRAMILAGAEDHPASDEAGPRGPAC